MEEDPPPGIPEWVVTFGDMMSLLLTFFIMLVSMSEIKQQERFQALLDSMQQRFGHDRTVSSLVPGAYRPRNTSMAQLTSAGRAKRADTLKGGDRVRAPVGENPHVRMIHPGGERIVGGVIYFAAVVSELTEPQMQELGVVIQEFKGKVQKIEVRGHASRKPLPEGTPYRDHWDLAYQRGRETLEYLVTQGIDRRRLRLSTAGDTEPADEDPVNIDRNDRVEIFLLNEVGPDAQGNP